MSNELLIILLSPLIAGVLAWVLDIKGVRELIGLVGAAVPVAYLAKLYSTVTNEAITYSIKVSGFNLGFQLNTITWYFAAIASLVGGLAMALAWSPPQRAPTTGSSRS